MAEFSEWDSQVFGYRVGTHRYADLPRDLGDIEGLDLVFARGPYRGQLPDPRSTVFEIQVDLRCDTSNPHTHGPVLLATDEDLPDVFRIADATLTGHRWGRDPRLAPHASEFYRRWLTAAHERKQIWIVSTDAPADDQHRCAGFVVVDDQRLSLIAIDPNFQRRGYGERLVKFFLCQGSGIHRVKTWIDNVAALNLYFQNGFRVESVECVEHVWLRVS